MLKSVLFAVLFLFIPALAFAGSFVDGVYTSRLGYSIKPPAGWVRLDASNAAAMEGHVPKNIDAQGISRFDVIFFPSFSEVDTSLNADNERLKKNKALLEENKNLDPEELIPPISDTKPAPEFSAMMSIIVLNSTPSNTADEMAKVYAENLVEEIKDVGVLSNFEVKASTKDSGSIPAGPDFNFSLGFRYNKIEYAVKQTVVFRLNGNETIIVTCMNNANLHEPDKMWCESALSTLRFE